MNDLSRPGPGGAFPGDRKRRIRAALAELDAGLDERVGEYRPYALTGRVLKVVGTIIHAAVPAVQGGELVGLYTRATGARLRA